MNIYSGTFDNTNWYQVFKNGIPFTHDETYRYVTHSPTGFAWGYQGSGPSQLAFALLLDVTDDPEYCKKTYQDFKWETVGNWDKDNEWEMTSEEIENWVKSNEYRHGMPALKKSNRI
jgi:hypothetical protein